MAAHALFTGPCEFVAGAMEEGALPPISLPEIAFAGRSNVGKSSLINALMGRRALARTSQTPGRTRQLNFFNVGDTFLLVDMPGYGYAKAAKTDIKRWTGLTRKFLCGRPTLRRVFLLVDARREATQDDREWMTMLSEAAVAFQIILTKSDKLTPAALQHATAYWLELARKQPAAIHEVLITSSERKEGIEALQSHILASIA